MTADAHPPEVRYAKSGDVRIAYQHFGSGEPLVWVPGWVSQLDLYWEEPSLERFLRRLGGFAHVIVFDRRGQGLSDRVGRGRQPTLEERTDDIRAVLDDLEIERAVVFGQGFASPIAIVFAATYPERTSGLVLYTAVAKAGLATADYPWGSTPESLRAWIERSAEAWGTTEFTAEWLRRLAPSVADEPRVLAWTSRVLRASGSPADATAVTEMNAAMDVRAILPTVSVPTLVIAREDGIAPAAGDDFASAPESRWVADRIPGARLVLTPGRDYLPWFDDQDSIVDEIAAFVTGSRPRREPERVLATLLFTDLVRSTERVAETGDRGWRDLLTRHNDAVRTLLARHGGNEVDRAGDGFLARFDMPGRATRCALEIVTAVAELGLETRAGVHTGEVEVLDDGIGGIAVHIGARVAALAAPSQVLVTRTVRDLTTGSGLVMEPHGTHELRGIAGEWELFSVAQR